MSEMVITNFIVTCIMYCLIIVLLYIILLSFSDKYSIYIFKIIFPYFNTGMIFFFKINLLLTSYN